VPEFGLKKRKLKAEIVRNKSSPSHGREQARHEVIKDRCAKHIARCDAMQAGLAHVPLRVDQRTPMMFDLTGVSDKHKSDLDNAVAHGGLKASGLKVNYGVSGHRSPRKFRWAGQCSDVLSDRQVARYVRIKVLYSGSAIRTWPAQLEGKNGALAL